MKKIITICIFLCLLSCHKVKYDEIGSFEYRIFNDSLFKNSYFHDSFGYVISDYDLKSIGINISSNNKLNKTDEYIFVLNHPIKRVIEFDDGIDYVKKTPIKVDLDTSKTTNKIYVYKLKAKDKYRLMLP